MINIRLRFSFLGSFKKSFSDFTSYVIPAVRAAEQTCGRARAGLAQLNTKQKDVKRIRVNCSNFRIQAQILELQSSRILWLNTYFPTDPQLQDYDDNELQEILEELRMIFNSTDTVF